ncbi:MAG: hypothetical protein QME58_13710 [Bacteroidota bacterium]|nr:hypothetical protein [Bacteroidota bacterium]
MKNEIVKTKGRPLAKIDAKLVQDLAAIFCTLEEIAAVVGCSVDTLSRRFMEQIKRGRETAKTSLRRLQFKSCKKGSNSMLIWLGKNYLGQREPSPIMFEPVGEEQANFDIIEIGVVTPSNKLT